jgi:uncharacterized membrane protein YbhN (UPF0104 family)
LLVKQREEQIMQVASSRKGTYLAVMGSVAFLFIVFLYVVPSFWSSEHPLPPLEFVGVLIVLAVMAAILWAWRTKLSARRLSRREGVVSGQVDVESTHRRS